MATYNGEQFIKEQLSSILTQLCKDDEIIVSDDASTDNTVALIQSIADPRIKLLHFNGNNVKRNFQNALQHARGNIIFLADQDDVWLPGKVETCCNALKQVDLVVTNSMVTDEELNITNTNFFNLYKSGPGILKNIFNNTYYGSCMAFKSDVLHYALPFPQTNEIGHDTWLGLTANLIGTVRFIRTPYLLYRRHHNTSTTIDNLYKRSQRPLWKKIWSRCVLSYQLLRFGLYHKLQQHHE
ncbi:MAG: glycosyltransferase family 2 protein [Paludibacter sp.]|nr:glycosyltransferase family 2 protein [Bacteroidales bacterium]MCM1068587.1 glycosyltransferase family 2 protein [Prevotella sp.]MCM1353251.1 glycosyltransferase family 2 protein [Bacteroides sp.]MCM1442341.1 glycosyltransferase family 2 protein [Muribaculum sp.]MCM1481160.1 glycosyltransferase family 2 protein [Paludibacter sp.]